MNPPPYQPYGVRQPPPQQQQQPAPGSTGLQQQAPLSNSFRPFNPAQQQQVNVPYQQQGPPSSGGNRGGPAGFGGQPSQGMGGPPRGFVPPTGPGFSGPSSQPGAQPSMQFQPPQNAPGSFQGRPSGPPAAQPTPFQPANGFQRPNGISGPPSFGNAAAPPMMRGPPGPPGPPIGPPTGPPTGPPHQPPMGLRGPPGAGGPALNQQFAQMGLGGPPTSAPPMGGPPGPPTGPPTGPSTGLAPPGVPTGPPGPLAPLRGNNPYTPSGPPMMNAPSAGGPGKPYAQPPSGNFQQPPEMMDGYGQQAQGMDGMPAQQMQQSPIPDELQASQCDPRYMRMTVGLIPHSMDHANKSHLPIGMICRPLAPLDAGEPEIDVVNFGPTGVVRCRHCRAYINPFVQWVDNGRRWRCNLCGVSNDVASSYFCHLGANGQRQDRLERPELSKGSVEIVAPSEYMMRPPQPPCFMFVLDVSVTAVASGALQVAVDTIRAQLDSLPGAPRTRVGFLTYDNSIHFYNLKSTLKAPQMMVVADLDELFIPIPDELLVNLSDSREQVEMLLETLPTIHQNARTSETAVGAAIRVAFKLMSAIGGKMMVFQSNLPSTGQGSLRNRENPRALGTDKEHTLLNPADTFYRSNAIDFCRQQISVDMFLFAAQYTDVASLGSLAKFSGGQVYYYPAFNAARDGEKFSAELAHTLTRETSWEGVVRMRCTKGMRLANFYGNHFLRGPDLLSVPTTNADSTFAVEITHSDALLSSNTISIQAAVLYTNSGGERRIRVHTLCVPVTKLFAELFRSADVDAICNLIAKNALEIALKSGLDSARSRLQAQCVDIVRAYKNSGSYGARQGQGGFQLHLPESLQLLPLYVMSLLKNSTLRGGTDLNTDERAFLQYQLNNMPIEQSRVFIYPRLFALHNMSPDVGLPAPEPTEGEISKATAGSQRIVLPAVINLSIERLACDGMFLMEDALTLYLWVGRSAPAPLLTSLFGLQTMEGVDCKQLKLLEPHDNNSRRVANIITAIREDGIPFQQVVIMREGDPSEGRFFWKLVDDRASFSGGSYSYAEYLGQISRLSISAAGR